MERITPKASFIAARSFCESLWTCVFGLSLEELTLDDDGKFWLVTLGINHGLSYKIFKVDAYNGEVVSMKIRTPYKVV